MARGLIGGMTDYSHQSFNDILEDLKHTADLVGDFIGLIEDHINKLTPTGYWERQPSDLKGLIGYTLKFFKTTQEELSSIHDEIQIHVQGHHCARLKKIAKVADDMNYKIGKYWNQDYERYKDYGNSEFAVVEHIYGDTRDMTVTLLDMDNLATRLKDFVGKTSFIMENKSPNIGNTQSGNNNVFISGNNNYIVNPSQIHKNDLNELEKLLINNEVPREDVDEIKEIVQTEQPDKEKSLLGQKANGWISKMVSKSLDGTWAIGIGAAGKLLADAIKSYYGLH